MGATISASFKNLKQARAAELPAGLEALEVGHETNPRAVPADGEWPPLPPSLRLLIVWASQLGDAGFVDGLTLRALYLSGKDTLDDITALAGQSELEALVLDARALEQFAPLREVPLQFLMAKRSRLSSWEDLPAATLRWLDLSRSKIKAGPGAPFERLEYLAASHTSIRDLDAMGHLPNLRRVHLWKAKRARGFSALVGCSRLNIVNLNETAVTLEEIEALLELPELTILACADTPASQAPGFAELQARARERKVSLCGTQRAFMDAHGFERRDVEYYLRVHQGERNPLRHLSSLGYRCSHAAADDRA